MHPLEEFEKLVFSKSMTFPLRRISDPIFKLCKVMTYTSWTAILRTNQSQLFRFVCIKKNRGRGQKVKTNVKSWKSMPDVCMRLCTWGWIYKQQFMCTHTHTHTDTHTHTHTHTADTRNTWHLWFHLQTWAKSCMGEMISIRRGICLPKTTVLCVHCVDVCVHVDVCVSLCTPT